MIKLGCMSLSYKDAFAAGTLDLEGFIERAYALRLDGIDIHTRALASTEPSYLREVRRLAMQRGLALSYIGISNDFGKPPAALDAEVAMAKHWIDVAAFMDITLVRVFAAWIHDGEPREQVWARMIPRLRELAEYGETKGVWVGLHNHNHGCVTATGPDVLRILREVDHPFFTHILDCGQYIGSPGATGQRGTEDPALDFYGSIAMTAPYAVHVRAKVYRIATGVEEWLNYPRILEILRGVGYNGWMSIVYEGQDAEAEATAVPKAVAYLRRVIQESGLGA